MKRKDDAYGTCVAENMNMENYEKACSSILGYTGTISSEELKERDDSKLTINSIVGKSGMEQYLDQVLQGRDGKKEVYVDNTGRTTQDLGVIQQPRAGKDVYLSIDVELQKKTYEQEKC